MSMITEKCQGCAAADHCIYLDNNSESICAGPFATEEEHIKFLELAKSFLLAGRPEARIN